MKKGARRSSSECECPDGEVNEDVIDGIDDLLPMPVPTKVVDFDGEQRVDDGPEAPGECWFELWVVPQVDAQTDHGDERSGLQNEIRIPGILEIDPRESSHNAQNQ